MIVAIFIRIWIPTHPQVTAFVIRLNLLRIRKIGFDREHFFVLFFIPNVSGNLRAKLLRKSRWILLISEIKILHIILVDKRFAFLINPKVVPSLLHPVYR